MKPFLYNVINSASLVTFGLWGYLSSDTPSLTALIPVIFGLLLLLFTKGLKHEKKLPAHIAVILTILVLLGLLKPFTAAINRADNMAIFRVTFMLLTSTTALISFIKSFIDARKKQ